jgi:hypothetical protein
MKSTNKNAIKNAFKAFGNLNRARSAKVPLLIVALTALIGFSMVACPDPYGGPEGGGGSNSGSGWPPSNVRSQYGIGGMSQPPGSGFTWATPGADPDGKWTSVLRIRWSPTSDTVNFVSNWFSSNGWSGEFSYDYTMGVWEKGTQRGVYSEYGYIYIYNNPRF